MYSSLCSGSKPDLQDKIDFPAGYSLALPPKHTHALGKCSVGTALKDKGLTSSAPQKLAPKALFSLSRYSYVS